MRIARGVLLTSAVLCVAVLCGYVYVISFVEREDARASAPDSTKFIAVADEQLAYSEIDNGSDTTVLFVGGLAAWNGTWQRVVEVQNVRTKRFNYVALDLPPFGYSSLSANQNHYRSTQAARIAGFVAAKKFKNVIAVGHSYGGGPITEYAMQHPRSVKKLILIDAVLNAGETKDVPLFSVVQLAPLRTVAIALLVHHDPIVLSRLRSFVYVQDHIDQSTVDLYTRAFNTRGLTARLSSWVRDYVRDPLVYKSTDTDAYRTLPFPVRLIWGDKDTLTPISGAEALVPIIPDARLTVLHEVGHIPMIEDYAAFDAGLADALDK